MFNLKIKFLVVSIFMILMIGCSGNEQKVEDTTNYEKMDWMLGVWEGKQGDADIYESWRKKNYRIMEGISYTTDNKQRVYQQSMRLEQSNNKIFLVMEPAKNLNIESKITFQVGEITANKVVFENPGNNFPQKVVYNKIGDDKMSVTLAGENDTAQTKLLYEKTMDL